MRNTSGVDYGIKLKLLVCVERNVEENQRCFLHAATIIITNATNTIATTQVKDIKPKLSRNV